MKKFLFVALMCLLSTISISAKKRYIEMAFYGHNIYLDNGMGDRAEKLKDDQGKDLKFKSLSSALNYMSQQGWELFATNTITDGFGFNGNVFVDTKTSYILCKEVSAEELDTIVSQGFQQKKKASEYDEYWD